MPEVLFLLAISYVVILHQQVTLEYFYYAVKCLKEMSRKRMNVWGLNLFCLFCSVKKVERNAKNFKIFWNGFSL